MSGREDISARKDRADSSETRDWDIPFGERGEPAEADVDKAGRTGPPEPDRGDAPGPAHGAPAEESERRDWDLP